MGVLLIRVSILLPAMGQNSNPSHSHLLEPRSQFWPKIAKILTFSQIGFLRMILKEPIGGGFVEPIKAYKSLLLKKF